MKLKEYLLLLRRHAALLVIATVLGGLGGFAAHTLMPTTYTARTELFVSVATSGDPYELQMGSSFIQERIQTYVDMARTGPVLRPVIDDLDLDTTPEELAGRVAAYSDPRTVLISVEATEETPGRAASVSRGVADSLVDAIAAVENPTGDETSRIRMTVSNPPTPPLEPDGLAEWIYIAIGVFVGLAIGLGLALLRAALDNKLRSREDLEGLTSASVLASIPDDPNIGDHPLIADLSLDDPRGEAFRRLRTNLGFAQVDDTNSAILVTSAQAQEGKSSTSINLAIALAQAGNRVALVDVDLRQPTVAKKTGLENSVGLTTALLGAVDVDDLLQPWGQDELYILTAGVMPPNPAELLDSRAMSALVARLTGDFDVVILDGPPLLPVSDGLALAKIVGRVLLIAGVGRVRLTDLQESLRCLEVLSAPISFILNRVPRSGIEMSGYYQPYASRTKDVGADHDGSQHAGTGNEPDGGGRLPQKRTGRSGNKAVRRTHRKRSARGTESANTPAQKALDAFAEEIWGPTGGPRAHIWPGRLGDGLLGRRSADESGTIQGGTVAGSTIKGGSEESVPAAEAGALVQGRRQS